MQEEKGLFSLVSKYRSELMGFSALWILFFHEWVYIFSDIPVIGNIEYLVKTFGYSGVDFFFFLSGMGLVRAIEKYTLPKFYIKRFQRLLLPFLLIGIIAALKNSWDIITFIKAVTGYSFLFENIFALLWFVPAIAIYYLLFPLYYRFFARSKNKFLFTFGSIQVWFLLSLFLSDKLRWDLFAITNRIPIFLLGILFGYIGANKDIIVSKSLMIFSGITLLLGLYLCYLTNLRDYSLLVPIPNVCLPPILLVVSLCPLISVLFEKCPKLGGFRKFLSFFGTISFELYCVQEILAFFLLSVLVEKLPYMLCNIIFFIVATSAAYLLYLLNKLLFFRRK